MTGDDRWIVSGYFFAHILKGISPKLLKIQSFCVKLFYV